MEGNYEKSHFGEKKKLTRTYAKQELKTSFKNEEDLEEKLERNEKNTPKVTPAKFWKTFFEKDFESNSMEVIARRNFEEIRKGKFKNGITSLYSNEIVALKYPLGKNHDYSKNFDILYHKVSCTLILHPNIVNYIGGLELYNPLRLGVIMEFVSSNLSNFIEKDNRSREIHNQIEISKQISSGMNFLHSLNPYILHRDLRSPNILINFNLECKIADFGFSNNLGSEGIGNEVIYTSLIPPECKDELGRFDLSKFNKKGDIYFFGWILFELFTRKKYEFENENNYIQILNQNNKIERVKELIIKSLEKNPSNRPSFFELLISFNNLLENSIDYSIICQIEEEDLNSIMNKYQINKLDLIKYSGSLGRKLVHEYCTYNNLKGLKELISIIGNEYLNSVDKYNCTCAHFASRNGNIQILTFLLENGFNKWNEKEKRFNLFPLSIAIAMKHEEYVKFLSNYSNKECLNESLISASQEGNLEYLKLFLEKGANINFTDKELSATPLWWSSGNGHFSIVKELINNGANLNQATTDNGSTPLYTASQNGYLEIVKELINNGANLNQARTDDGFTPLYTACENGYFSIVKELINNRANLNQGRTDDGSIPLIIATFKGYFSIVKELINKGANLNQEITDSGFTPLYIASQEGHLKLVKELINNGANLNQTTTGDGSTPLIIATFKGHLEIVKELINKGANLNQGRTDNGATPLIIASFNRHFGIVKELINNGANINQARTDNGATPLFMASQKEYLSIVKELINNGANLNQATTDNGCTPLYIASFNGYLSIVKELINKGANLNQATTDNGITPLYIACQNGHLEIVKELIKNRANLNQETTDNGATPLYTASFNGYLSIVKELIKNGSNLNQARTDDKSTPLFIACQNGHLSIVKELINKGANLNSICISEEYDYLFKYAKDLVEKDSKYSFTPIYIAWWNDKEKIISILKDISDIELNIKLAKQNSHFKALKFFESLQGRKKGGKKITQILNVSSSSQEL